MHGSGPRLIAPGLIRAYGPPTVRYGAITVREDAYGGLEALSIRLGASMGGVVEGLLNEGQALEGVWELLGQCLGRANTAEGLGSLAVAWALGNPWAQVIRAG